MVLTRLDDFSGIGFDKKQSAIEMLDRSLEATQSLSQCQIVVHEKIFPLSLEPSVLLLLEDKHYVSRDRIRLQR